MAEPHLIVLYGTETANPGDIAKRVVWEGFRRRARATATPLPLQPFDRLSAHADSVLLFIVSTMGQGEPPLNLVPFWKWLMRKSMTATSLSGATCAVIGLGDSSYEKYNFVGKKLFKRLRQLGAEMLLDLCLGDDQHDFGYCGAVDPFLDQLWQSLTLRFKLPHFTLAPDSLPPPTFSFSRHAPSPSSGVLADQPVNGCRQVTVISNERVTTENHFQETRFLRLSSGGLSYNCGDVVAILPENSSEDVDDFLSLLCLQGHERVTISVNDGNRRTPPVFSFSSLAGSYDLKDVVRTQFDLHAVPQRSFFDLFWKFSQDETEKAKLKEFATTEGQEELFEYCYKPKRMVIEILGDFPKTSAQIPLDYLPELLPAVKPREFSIASSAKVSPSEMHILVVVVEYQTRLKRPRTGFCSKFLSQLVAGDSVTASVGKGSFCLPVKRQPLIMVGPGSGVAPFRGIIQDRVADGIRDNLLFFGCRNKLADFYFEEDWRALTTTGDLRLFAAFSRDQVDKDYVQHRMHEQKDLILDWMVKRDAVILIAGSSNQMPSAVRKELVSIFDEFVGDGESHVTRLESGKRLQYECWD